MEYHEECQFSTNIAGEATAGQGKLDNHGEWQFPCNQCRDELKRRLDENKGEPK